MTSPGRGKMVERLGPWFHNLHLPDGTQTAPEHRLGDFPRYKWEVLGRHIPENLDGWTALDLGCNAGFYSFELARRGARVTAIDLDERYLQQARWAASEFGLQHAIEFRQMQVYELAGIEAQFDLVLFMGLFYHLRYPMLGLDLVASHTGRLLVFQTLTMPGFEVEDEILDQPLEDREVLTRPGWPTLAFIEHSFAGDPTNPCSRTRPSCWRRPDAPGREWLAGRDRLPRATAVRPAGRAASAAAPAGRGSATPDGPRCDRERAGGRRRTRGRGRGCALSARG